MYTDIKSDRKKNESMVIFVGLFMCNNILYGTLPPSIKNSNLIYLHTNLFLCSSCRVHPALLLKLHLLSVSFRLIMPWHSAKIVSLKDVTRALTQHSMSWNILNTGLAQAAIWTPNPMCLKFAMTQNLTCSQQSPLKNNYAIHTCAVWTEIVPCRSNISSKCLG